LALGLRFWGFPFLCAGFSGALGFGQQVHRVPEGGGEAVAGFQVGGFFGFQGFGELSDLFPGAIAFQGDIHHFRLQLVGGLQAFGLPPGCHPSHEFVFGQSELFLQASEFGSQLGDRFPVAAVILPTLLGFGVVAVPPLVRALDGRVAIALQLPQLLSESCDLLQPMPDSFGDINWGRDFCAKRRRFSLRF
jgi:hypothetical protein